MFPLLAALQAIAQGRRQYVEILADLGFVPASLPHAMRERRTPSRQALDDLISLDGAVQGDDVNQHAGNGRIVKVGQDVQLCCA